VAILTIRKYPDKVLRKTAAEVGVVTENTKKLIRDMFDTMYFSKGVGLSAPQVGISKRIVVCNPTGQKRDELAIINPEILYKKGRKVKDCEGCLSVPQVSGEVLRYSKIGVSGLNPDGKEMTIDAEGIVARILDHEIDHLNGVLFIDKLGFFKKKRLLNKYNKKIDCIGRNY